MEIKEEEKINENGSYSKTTTITTTKEDGWINEKEVFINNIDAKNRYIKGNLKSIHYETNNPRITKLVTRIASEVGGLIGIIVLFLGIFLKNTFLIFFGIIFIITIVMFFVNSQKQIKDLEKELEQKVTENK